MDITETPDLGDRILAQHIMHVKYPTTPAYNETIRPMLKELNKTNMHRHLERFTSFHTRFYKSSYGAESSKWLLETVNKTMANAIEHGATVEPFVHSWGSE